MSKRIFAIAVLVMMLFLFGCEPSNNTGGANNDGADNGDTENGGSTDGGDTKGSVEEKNEEGEFFFKGRVTSVSDPYFIEVEIIDSQVASGIYWVNVSAQTEYIRADSVPINREDIKVGDTIEIIFSGQVMMSYPPRIAAQKIILK